MVENERKVGEENAHNPYSTCQHRAATLSQAAANKQQNTETLEEIKLTKGKGEQLVCDQKSTKKLEAEICWAFFLRVSTLTENPNQVMRAKGSHCLLVLVSLRLI